MLREDHRYIGFRGKINNSFLVHMQKLDNRPQHKTAPKIRRQKQTYIDTNTYSIEQTHMSKIRHKHSYTLHFTSKLAHENTLTYRQALKIKHTPTHTKPHKCVAQHTYAITYTVFAILFNKQSVTKRRLQRGYFACTVEYGWVCLERRWIFIGIQFMRHFLELVRQETLESVNSKYNLLWRDKHTASAGA